MYPSSILAVGLVALLFPSVARAQPFVDVSSQLGAAWLQGTHGPRDCLQLEMECRAPYTGGAAVGDYDRDGDPDIFYARFGAPDILFENQGDGTFMDVAPLVGIEGDTFSNGAAFVDVDNDGDLDLAVTHALVGSDRLYINDAATNPGPGRPMFVDDAAARGFLVSSTTGNLAMGGSVATGDYDRDGWPDLFITEWLGQLATCGIERSRLLRNRGGADPGKFDDLTSAAGLGVSTLNRVEAWTFAAGFRDLDDDGFQDLPIVGDFVSSRLMWNSGDRTFENRGASSGVGTDRTGMGSTFADVDRDGDFDWFVSAIHRTALTTTNQLIESWDGNRLYRNDGQRTFTDVTDSAGVRDTDWAWGSAFLDSDHDGDHDLLVTNGFNISYVVAQRNHFFEQTASGTFVDRSTLAGFDDLGFARGLVTLDYDADGDLDAFVVRNAGTPLLLRNDGGSALGDWLQVRVQGRVGTRDGYGTVVHVTPSLPDASTLMESVDSSTDFLGQSERVAHFGLGPGFVTSGQTLHVRVSFLSGHVVELTSVTPNQSLWVTEPLTAAPRGPAQLEPTGCDGPADPCEPDCDANFLQDECELQENPGLDCNGTDVIDRCEIASGLEADCDENQAIDSCELAEDPELDGDGNGTIDVCDRASMDAGMPDSATEPTDVGPPADGGTRPRGSSCSVLASESDRGVVFPLGWLGAALAGGVYRLRRFGASRATASRRRAQR